MKRLLVFQHIEREHPSNIAEYAKEKGMTLDIARLWEGSAIPRLSEYDALIVLGGPMGVYDDFAWKDAELAAIREAVGRVPVLGICLGAQLLAHALGGRVYPCEEQGKRVKEIGYYDVELTPAGKGSRLFDGFPARFRVLQWHGDTFDVPRGADLLASAAGCPGQAFSYDGAFGLQFHLEATPGIVDDWIREDAAWIHDGFDFDEARVRKEAEELAAPIQASCYRLMDNLLSA